MGQHGGQAPAAVRTGAAAGRELVVALEFAASAPAEPAGAASVGGAGQAVVGGVGQGVGDAAWVVAGGAGRAVVGGVGQASVPSADAVFNLIINCDFKNYYFYFYLIATILLGWDARCNPALLTGRSQQSQQNNQH